MSGMNALIQHCRRGAPKARPLFRILVYVIEGENVKENKISRVLSLYSQLLAGHTVDKKKAARDYAVNERSIQRDIEDIRAFCRDELAKNGPRCDVVYDYAAKVYRMEGAQLAKLSNSEVLALCKILLDSRAFVKTEMEDMLQKVIACCVPEKNRALITKLVNNEAFHYVEPRHRTSFLNALWQLGQAIEQHQYVNVAYGRAKDHKIVTRRLKPLALLFSEFRNIIFISSPSLTIRKSLRFTKAPGILRRPSTAWTGSRA